MMLQRHVSNLLSAYCHDELPAAQAARVTSHLEQCAGCREECEQIRLGIALAERLPQVAAPESLWVGIEHALNTHRRPQPRPLRRWQPVAAAACVVALIVLWMGMHSGPRSIPGHVNPPPGQRGPTWEVARIAGEPHVGAQRIERKGRIAVGQWLETDGASKARIAVADIGQVEVDPNTRIGLVGSRANEHRLALTRGSMHAKVSAPPRLFLVDTPSATAVDLGCAYSLRVDEAGRSYLRVTSGWVAFERGSQESMVPAGAQCETRPLLGPGTPCFEDASPAFQSALRQLDFEHGGDPALRTVLQLARPKDTLTLWHLLSSAPESLRGPVYDRLSHLSPPPPGVTRQGILNSDRHMLDLWKETLEPDWWSGVPGLSLFNFRRAMQAGGR